MEPLSPLDASFLHLEDGVNHLHIASCAIFEGPAPLLGELTSLLAAKLPLVPRYRQRVRFVPFQLGPPVWVDAADFRVEDHVHRVALPAPGGDDELRATMAWLMEAELDRSRPLWEAYLVQGLAGGRWAMISKVHHCMVDGVAGVDLLTLVLDTTPVGTPPGVDDWVPEPEPSPVALAARGVLGVAAAPVVAARGVVDAVRHPSAAVRRGRDVAAGLASYASHLGPVPRTSVVGRIGPHRRWTYARAELADVRRIRRRLGGTVNDVVLAAVTGGFRDLLVWRGEDVDHAVVRTLVPVNVRPDDARGACHNLVSAIFAELPVAVADPVARLDAVRAEMAALKGSHQVDAGEALSHGAALLPSPLVALAERAASRLGGRVQHSVTTVATNVPGPQFPLFALGRRMLEYLPYVPIAHGVRVGVAILSYDGHLAFGVTGDWTWAPDIGVVATGIERSVAELVEVAGPMPADDRHSAEALVGS